MARGVLSLYVKSAKCFPKKQRVVTSTGTTRWISSNVSSLQKEAVAEKLVQGTPYSKLTIGVPKEVWKEERR